MTAVIPARFAAHAQDGQCITVTLPEQQPMNDAGEPASPPAEIVIFHQHGEHRALRNALDLLDTLYAYGVTSPHVLRLILTATGQRRSEPANASLPCTTGEARTSPEGTCAHAE